VKVRSGKSAARSPVASLALLPRRKGRSVDSKRLEKVLSREILYVAEAEVFPHGRRQQLGRRFLRDAPSVVVLDLFMDAQPASKLGRPHRCPELTQRATGRAVRDKANAGVTQCKTVRIRMGS
jgi:hypothetical protein